MLGRERVAEAATRLGLAVEFVEHGPDSSLEEAAIRLGVVPRSIVKSLVVKRPDGAYLFALVPGDRQIAWPKLRALLGVNRLRLPPPEQALAVTGFERGTITPLGSTTTWPVVADALVAGRVALGAGDHGLSAVLDAEDLLAALDATVADITQPVPGT